MNQRIASRSLLFVIACLSFATYVFFSPTHVSATQAVAYAQIRWSGGTKGIYSVISIPAIVANAPNCPIYRCYVENKVLLQQDSGSAIAAGLLAFSDTDNYPHLRYFYSEQASSDGSITFYLGGSADGSSGNLMSAQIWMSGDNNWYQVTMQTPNGQQGPYYPNQYNFSLSPNNVNIGQELANESANMPLGSWTYTQWFDSSYAPHYQTTPSSSDQGNSRQLIRGPEAYSWYSYPADPPYQGGVWLTSCNCR